MSRTHNLHWLSLAAIGRSPDHPFVSATYRIARSPELWSNAGVGGVLEKLSQFAVFYLVCGLHAKLEVETPIIDAPTAL